MFGYEFIKTIDLDELKAKLATSDKDKRNLAIQNEVLSIKVGVLENARVRATPKRMAGKFESKVKMFEPFKIFVTPAQSKRVQELLFADGISWRAGGTEIKYCNYPVLVYKDDELTFRERGTEMKNGADLVTEITYRQFMRIYSSKKAA